MQITTASKGAVFFYFSYYDFLRTTNTESSSFRWVTTSFEIETRSSVIYRQSKIHFRWTKVENVPHWRSTEPVPMKKNQKFGPQDKFSQIVAHFRSPG